MVMILFKHSLHGKIAQVYKMYFQSFFTQLEHMFLSCQIVVFSPLFLIHLCNWPSAIKCLITNAQIAATPPCCWSANGTVMWGKNIFMFVMTFNFPIWVHITYHPQLLSFCTGWNHMTYLKTHSVISV